MKLHRLADAELAQRTRAGVDEIANAADIDQRLPLSDRRDDAPEPADHALSLC